MGLFSERFQYVLFTRAHANAVLTGTQEPKTIILVLLEANTQKADRRIAYTLHAAHIRTYMSHTYMHTRSGWITYAP